MTQKEIEIARLSYCVYTLSAVIYGTKIGDPLAKKLFDLFRETISQEEYESLRGKALLNEQLNGKENTLITRQIVDEMCLGFINVLER